MVHLHRIILLRDCVDAGLHILTWEIQGAVNALKAADLAAPHTLILRLRQRLVVGSTLISLWYICPASLAGLDSERTILTLCPCLVCTGLATQTWCVCAASPVYTAQVFMITQLIEHPTEPIGLSNGTLWGPVRPGPGVGSTWISPSHLAAFLASNSRPGTTTTRQGPDTRPPPSSCLGDT